MKLPILFVALVLATPVFAQPDSSRSIGQTFVHDLKVSYDDLLGFFSAPLHADGGDTKHLFSLAGSTATLVYLDKEYMDFIRRVERTKTLNDIMDFGHGYGDMKYALYLPAGLYLGGLFGGNEFIRVTGRQIFQALAYSALVTQAGKWIVGRARPEVRDDPWLAKPLNFRDPKDEWFSMPSGHATAAFAISTVLVERINNVFASVVLYGLAATTAISRVYHNRHWVSDVFVAGVIGSVAGIFVSDQEKERTKKDDTSQLELLPSFNGLTLQYKF